MDITVDVLKKLIEDSIAARADVDAKRRDLQELMFELDREHAQLRAEEEAYRSAIARLFPEQIDEVAVSSDADVQAPPTGKGFASLPRTEAVKAAVWDLGSGSSAAAPAEIEDYLHERGRTDTRDNIGAALAYLHRKHLVRRVSRGQWRPAGGI